MTIQRANEIVDGIESVLTSPCHVGGNFTPLSRTGAKTRAELAHAIYVVTAQVFQTVQRSHDTRRYLIPGFTLKRSDVGLLVKALVGWARLELVEGWHTWFNGEASQPNGRNSRLPALSVP